MWVLFWDMHSGGGSKEDWQHIYIEANSKEEAKIIFYNRFGHNPDRVSCTCCGQDYSISSAETLEEASAYHRGCHWDDKKKKYIEEKTKEKYSFNQDYIPLNKYIKDDAGHFIFAKDIKEEEREGDVPEQGFVWM